jgi:hypothetical protein
MAIAMTRKPKTVRVRLALDEITVTLLDVTASHLGKSRAETVAEGLRCLFVSIPRPDEIEFDGAGIPWSNEAPP